MFKRYSLLALTLLLIGILILSTGCYSQPSNKPASSEQQNELDSKAQEISPEAYVLLLFKGNETSEDEAKKIISVLPKLNWSLYEKQSNGGAIKLLTWLYERKCDNMEVQDIANILKATQGLDGAFVEQYANIVGKLCYNNLERFIDALTTLDNKQAEQIYKFLKYSFTYDSAIDKDSLKKQLNTLLNSQKTTKVQKEVIKKAYWHFAITQKGRLFHKTQGGCSFSNSPFFQISVYLTLIYVIQFSEILILPVE